MIPLGTDPRNQLRHIRVDNDGFQITNGAPNASQPTGGTITFSPQVLFGPQLYTSTGFNDGRDWVLSSVGLTEAYGTTEGDTTNAAVWLNRQGVRLQCGLNPGNKSMWRQLLSLPNTTGAVAGPRVALRLPEGLPLGYRLLFGLATWDGKDGYYFELTGTASGKPTARIIIRKSTGAGPNDFIETAVPLTDRLDGAGPSGETVDWTAPTLVYGNGSLSAPIRTTYYINDRLSLESRLLEAPAGFHQVLPLPGRLGVSIIVENTSPTPLGAIARAMIIEPAYVTTSSQAIDTTPTNVVYAPEPLPAFPAAETAVLLVRHAKNPGTEDRGVWPGILKAVADSTGTGIIRAYRMDYASDWAPYAGATWTPNGDGLLEYAAANLGATTPAGKFLQEMAVIAGWGNGESMDIGAHYARNTGLGWNTETDVGTGLAFTYQKSNQSPNLVELKLEAATP